jgi:hypothetical protein
MKFCKEKDKTCIRCSEKHNHHFTECNKEPKCANCGKDHAACAKNCEHLIKYQEKDEKEKAKRLETNFIRINSAAGSMRPELKSTNQTTNNTTPPTHMTNNYTNIEQLQQTQHLIYRSNLRMVSFIIEILKNLNEMIQSVNETPQYITNVISNFFGDQLAREINKNLQTYVNERIYVNEEAGENEVENDDEIDDEKTSCDNNSETNIDLDDEEYDK